MTTLAALTGGMLFPGAMVFAGLMDVATMKIRNGLVLLLLAAYAVLAPLAGLGVQEIGWSMATAALVLLCAFIFFARGWIGGGDAKLAAVAALWLGADHALAYFAFTALFGGVIALMLLQFRALALPLVLQKSGWIARIHSPQAGVPYGVAMAAAALVVFPETPWLNTLL